LDENNISMDSLELSVASTTESLNILNLSLTETQNMLAALTDRVNTLESKSVSAENDIALLSGAVTDLGIQLAGFASGTAGLDLSGGVYDGLIANSLVVSSLAEFGGITVEKHAVFGEDTVGQAKILAGHNFSAVTFAEPYELLPIISVTPVDFDGKWKLSEIATTGFKILLSEPQASDVLFNWQALGASADSKIYVSDGTTAVIGLQIVYTPELPVEESVVTEEVPVEEEQIETPVDEPLSETETPADEAPAGDLPADEALADEAMTEETPSDEAAEEPSEESGEPAEDSSTTPTDNSTETEPVDSGSSGSSEEPASSVPSPDGSDGATPAADTGGSGDADTATATDGGGEE